MAVNSRLVEFAELYWSEYLGKIEQAVAPLAEEQLWWRPNEGSNSIANLLAHLHGNLSQWVLAGLGGEPFERHRDAEFAARGPAGRRPSSSPISPRPSPAARRRFAPSRRRACAGAPDPEVRARRLPRALPHRRAHELPHRPDRPAREAPRRPSRLLPPAQGGVGGIRVLGIFRRPSYSELRLSMDGISTTW
jgi:hypothetical protein